MDGPTVLEKWKKAVVHIECAGDSEAALAWQRGLDQLQQEAARREISPEEFKEEWDKEMNNPAGIRDRRLWGTAVFMTDAGRKYLLTARHVLFDEKAAIAEVQSEVERNKALSAEAQAFLAQLALKNSQGRAFRIFFRVPSLDEAIAYKGRQESDFILGLNEHEDLTFSDPSFDLAIVSLDLGSAKAARKRFVDHLLGSGHLPIALDDISDQLPNEGSDIFTVGFPYSTSVLEQMHPPLVGSWSPSCYSLPSFAFGRVSMSHEQLRFFWVDISAYPGNSGGPVVENGKLVGIVSGQAKDLTSPVQARIPFGMIIRSKYIRELLKVRQQEEDYFLNEFGRGREAGNNQRAENGGKQN